MTGAPGDQPTRWSFLLDALAERRRLSVAEGAELLGVSAATVRRDFRELARLQLATRTHGGVVATGVAYDLPARYRLTDEDPKQRIAEVAADLVGPGEVVAFNGGTTTSAAARRLGGRTELTDVTVVTNALNIAADLVLRPHLRTVCLGGEARQESYELFGPFASAVLDRLRLHRLFLGVHALSVEAGATCRHLGESEINAAMVTHAAEVTVLATGEKLGQVSLARICEIGALRRLITDRSADERVVDHLRAAGLDVVQV